jgi:ADP-heptose:LPS heptosyltransferase
MKRLEIIFKNFFLNFLLLINPNKKLDSDPVFNQNSKILFIRLNRIGDALVTTPLIHLLKEKLGCEINILADKKNHFIYQNNPSIKEVLIFKKGLKGFIGVYRFIKEKHIDTIVDLHDDVSTTVSFLIALAKTKNKLALKKSNWKIYTQTIERLDSTNKHVIKRNLELLKLFKISYNEEEIRVRYFPKQIFKKQADFFITSNKLKSKFLLGINISAGSSARFWGIDRYKKLIELINNYDLNFLVFHDPKDTELANQITDQMNIYPSTEYFDIIALGILQLDMLFTPDTSLVHIASMKKIPVFGIYVKYNTTDMIWSPYNTDFECIITEEPTLKNVSFEEVKIKFIPFLENQMYAKRNSIL